MNRYEIEGSGPGARFTRTIQDAGFDVGNENDLQMGMIAYNAAQLVWRKYYKGRVQAKMGPRAAQGRNRPCPCGSGLKYKKCCLKSDAARSQVLAPPSSVSFGPGIVPHFSSDAGMMEDCRILSQVMDRDQELKKVCFSHSRVESFLEKVSREQDLPTTKDRLEEKLDRLAVRFATESGEGKIVEGLIDKFIEAASRATTEEDLRGLAAGVCLGMMAMASNDPNDDILSIMIFRRTLKQAIMPSLVEEKMLDRLGEDPGELRRRAEARDPKLLKDIEESFSALAKAEKEELQAYVERNERLL